MAESNQDSPLSAAQRRKNELIAELARSRSGMSLHAGQATYQADVPRRLKSSVREHLGFWLTGAVVAGGAISLLPMRERKVYVNPLSRDGKSKVEKAEKVAAGGGFFLMLLRFLTPIIKPIITGFVTRRLASMLRANGDDDHHDDHRGSHGFV